VEALAGDSRPQLVAFPPTDRFGPPPAEAEVRARAGEPGPLRVIFLGNVIPRKGLHTLLAAVRLLPLGSVVLDVIGSVTGSYGYAQSIRRLAHEAGGEPHIRFRGALDEAALRRRLEWAHVLAVPSSYEGFGIVYLEGMGFGLPAIGTTAGGAGEVITDGRDGFLIPPGEPPALAERLAKLAGDRSLLVQMALAARRRYLDQPPWEKTCAEIRGFLLTLAAG
jgi:glycosyltransferase involved in cell wall biosynthesis